MPRQRRCALPVLLCLAMGIATASPTPNEYTHCHQLAAQRLQRCLDERPGYANDHCWDGARKAQQQCYADVVAAHVPDRARIEAERRARSEVR